MKKILANNIVENVRRQPFNKVSIEHLQAAFQEVFADMMKGLTTSAAGTVALYGCIDSDADALEWDISAGAVLYDGEVFRVPAFVGSHATNVPVLSMVTSYDAADPVKFTDNNNFNVHEIRTMVWTMGVSGSGLVDFDDLKLLKDHLKPGSVVAADGSLIKFKKMPLPEWNMDDVSYLEIAHELPAGAKVFDVHVMIRNNAGDHEYPLDAPIFPAGTGNGMVSGGWSLLDDETIFLCRTNTTGGADSGIFDNEFYDGLGYSRGYMVIEYYE